MNKYYVELTGEAAYFSALPSKAKLIEMYKLKKLHTSKIVPKFQNQKPHGPVKITVVGSGAVGKTSLCLVYDSVPVQD